MNLISLVQNEFIKPLVTLIIPGGVVITPIFAFLYCHYQSIRDALGTKLGSESSQAGIIIFLLLVCALAVGLIIEDLGSRVESVFRNICKRNKSSINQDNNYFEKTWRNYLNLEQKESGKIGLKYIDNILLNLKFELSMGIALILSSSMYLLMVTTNLIKLDRSLFTEIKILPCINQVVKFIEQNLITVPDLVLFLVLLIIGMYLLWEAYSSVESLHWIRAYIIEEEGLSSTQGKSNITFSLVSFYSSKVKK
jgi:hypothetical protein